MTEGSAQFGGRYLEDLIARVTAGAGRDWELDRDIAVSLQYLPDALVEFSNVRAHPTSTMIMHYDTQTKVGASAMIPMLTSSLDAVEKLRAWGAPNWIIDALHVRDGEYLVRATSDGGASLQATASSEARARLLAVLQALGQRRRIPMP